MGYLVLFRRGYCHYQSLRVLYGGEIPETSILKADVNLQPQWRSNPDISET